jgi:hypothetical protein
MKHYTIDQSTLKRAQQRGDRLADVAIRLIRLGKIKPEPAWSPLRPTQYRIELNEVCSLDGEWLDSVRVIRPFWAAKKARVVSRGRYWAVEQES